MALFSGKLRGLTFNPLLDPSGMLDFFDLTFSKERSDQGEEAFYGGADRFCFAAGGLRDGGRRGRAQAGDQRADALPPEGEVRRLRELHL